MAFGLWLLLVAGSASDTDASVSQFAEAIRDQFSHAQAKISEVDWKPSRFREGCPPLKTSGPAVMINVRSPNTKVFGSVTVFVERLAEDVDAYEHVLTMGKDKPRGGFENCGFISKAPVALIQYKRLWITVHGHCGDGGLYPYEVAEVLQTIAARSGGEAPRKFLHSSCGSGFPSTTDTAAFLESLQTKRTYWGKEFPQARDSAKAARRAPGAAQPGVAPGGHLVLVGTVTKVAMLNDGPSPTDSWTVTVTVDRIVSGDFSGPTFTFAIHSPGRAGLKVGKSCTIKATWTKNGYVSNEPQVPCP